MANNLEVKIKIGADDKEALDAFVALSRKVRDTQSDFRAAQDTVQRLAREIKASDAPSKELTNAFEKAKKTVSDLSGKLDTYRNSLSQQRAALTAAGVDVANLSEAYQKLARSSEAAAKARTLGDSFKTLDFKPFSEIQAKIDSLNAAYNHLATSGKLSMGELAKAKLQLKDKTAELHSQMNNFTGALDNLNGKWLAFAGALAGAGVAFKGLIDAGVKMEAIKSQLDAVTGSGAKTADALKYIQDESNRLGQRTDVMSEGFAKLAAAAKGTALEGAPLKEVFSAVAEASTVMHLSADRTNGVLNALSQMMGKGVVSAEEFRQQLGDQLPQATQVGAKALGVTTAEFTKMLNSGQILAADFLPKFGQALRDSVAGGLPQAANGATAAFNRLYNAVLAFKQGLVDGAIMRGVAVLANALAKLLETVNKFSPITKTFIAALATLAGGFAAWRLAIAPVVSAIGSALIPVMAGATLATGALSVALRALPFVGLGLAIFEAGRAFYGWISGANQAQQATQQLNQETTNIGPQLDAAVAGYDAAFAKMSESMKALTEAQKVQYAEQLAALDAKLAQEMAAITTNAGLSEQQKEQAKNEAFVAASAQRLQLIQAFQALQLQQLDAYHEQERAAKQAQLDSLNADEMGKRQTLQQQLAQLDLGHLQARREVYAQAQTDLNAHITNLVSERQRELDAANTIARQIVGNENAREQAILTIQRAAMSEKELMRSKEQEEAAKIATFKAELAKGEGADQEKLNTLANDAAKLITNNAVEKAKAAKSGWLADQVTKAGVSQVNEIYDDLNEVLGQSKTAHDENAVAIGGEMESAQQALSSVSQAIDAIDRKLIDAKQVVVEVERNSLQKAQAIIADLVAPATKIITIQTQNAAGQATGGLAGQPTGLPWRNSAPLIAGFAVGGFARKQGKLAGYGGGDKIQALLEPGEFIVRKEAVQKLGVPVLQAVNQGVLPLQRRWGGSIGDAVNEAIKKDKLEAIKQALIAAQSASAYEAIRGRSSLFANRAREKSLSGINLAGLDPETADQVREAMANVPEAKQLKANRFTSLDFTGFLNKRNEPIREQSIREGYAFKALLDNLGKVSSKTLGDGGFKIPSIPTLPTTESATMAPPSKTITLQFKAPDGSGQVAAAFNSEADVSKMLDILKQSGARVGA
ncbi:tape measure protein [Methylomonas rapida]|uniref:Tape measure protein n=1 Tax=Methylomonas rapida TaxID=2963939 RepID=A0ABY7GG27_9GAMM|nr:tape measure protein [Methylomonas rapida]WAR42938.1 tape measure protein [Methylomonas rapida]